MKIRHQIILTGALCFGMVSAHAQIGARPVALGSARSVDFSGSTAKLFGDNSAFSALLEMQSQGGPAGETMTTPGKLAFDQGKSRFEMDLAQMQNTKMPPEAAAQMKSIGMDKIIMISRPDKKVSYLVYPGLQSYVESPIEDPKANAPASDFKLETTELGKEVVDGHPCIKNKAVVTDKEGAKREATIWNATDLKKFPVKIEQTEQGAVVTMLFKQVNLSKPETSLFTPPADFTKYDSVQAMMQQAMMKRLGGAPTQRPPGNQP